MSYFMNNQAYRLGIDLSVYNLSPDQKRSPDFDQIAAHVPKVEFIAIRTSQSFEYRDPVFLTFLEEALRIGVCALPYHVLYPGVAALKQMDTFLDVLDGVDLDCVRLVLDVELEHNQPRSVITNTLSGCLDLLYEETGRYPILYSRAHWIDAHVEVGDLPQVGWWLAQYQYRREPPEYTPEYPCPPTLPKGVTSWLIHQTAERAPAIGGAGRYMDYNRWNGARADLLAYFGKIAEKPPIICPLDGQECPAKTTSGSPDAYGKSDEGSLREAEAVSADLDMVLKSKIEFPLEGEKA